MRGAALLLLLPLALAACQGTQDPSRAGFFDGVRNLSDGTYDRRREARETTLAARQADALEARATALSAERGAATAAARRQDAERRMARLAGDLRQDQARIADLRRQRGTEATGLSAEAARIEAERAAAARRGADAAALADLEARQQALRRAVDAAYR
jgi:chromosome segregation ATPase